jgi:transcriptional regulator with XRE-family HTH domain
MNRTTGERLRALRDLKAWTQEELASAAGVGLRTVQRIEGGDAPNPETLKALAAAFDVEVTALSAGLTVDDLVELRRAYTCPKCGAPLSERTFVTHEYGDAEFEIFECGSTRGWQDRPCPRDPQFPAFEDYDLHFLQGSGGDWHCLAVGKTRHARQVGLRDGRGNSREEAEAWVTYSYIEAKDGHSAAEKYMFEHLPHLPSLSEYSQLSLALWRRPD